MSEVWEVVIPLSDQKTAELLAFVINKQYSGIAHVRKVNPDAHPVAGEDEA